MMITEMTPTLQMSCTRRAIAAAACLTAAVVLSACGATNPTSSVPTLGQTTTVESVGQPVSLTGRTNARATPAASTLKPLNPDKTRRAIERYLLNSGGKPATHKVAGADLDGDGRPEAIVYLEGDDWCVTTGCTLVIMRDGTTGLKAVSVTKRARLPVAIAGDATVGWRDLLVRTGIAGTTRLVTLKFNGSAYSANASTLPPTVTRLTDLPEIALRADPAAIRTAAPGSNLIPGQN